jgi:hypothetical protein
VTSAFGFSIMTELRDLLDGWSPPDASSGDQSSDELSDSNTSSTDVSMPMGDVPDAGRLPQLQLDTDLDDKDHHSWAPPDLLENNWRDGARGGRLPSVVEPAPTESREDSSVKSSSGSSPSVDDATYSSFNYWNRSYDPTIVDEDASTSSSARWSAADGDDVVLRSFMERHFDSPMTPSSATTTTSAILGKPPASQPIAITHKRPSMHTDSNSTYNFSPTLAVCLAESLV